jgi:hypothetical protein
MCYLLPTNTALSAGQQYLPYAHDAALMQEGSLTKPSTLCSGLLLCPAVRAWGEEGIWLHVAEDNTPAQALYTTRGYTRVQGASDRPFSLTPIIPKRQLLLTKPLAPRSSNQSSSGSSAGAVVAAGGVGDVQEGGQTGAEMAANEAAGASSSSSSSSSGVYTWQVATQPKAEK